MRKLSFYYGFLSQILDDSKLYNSPPYQKKHIIQKRLKKIISFARKNTGFYNELYKDISLNASFDQYPIITKKDMVESFDTMVTDKRINHQQLKEYFSKPFNFDRRFLNQYLAFHTSGSSGNPAYIVWGNREFGISTANYFLKVRRFCFPHISIKKLRALKVAYIGITDDYVGGNSWAYGLTRLCKLKIFSIFQNFAALVSELNRFQPDLIMTKPSLLGELARKQGAGQLCIKPQHVVFAGEMINPVDALSIEKYFGVKVSNSYSTCESGPIAFQSDNETLSLEVFQNMVYLEIVDDNNRPITETGVYGNIVITNLYNTIMPVIRYKIGDGACFLPSLPGEKTISYIQGRNTTFFEFEFNNKKTKVSEYLFWSLYVSGIQRYQVKQTSLDTIIILIEWEKDLIESVKSEIKESICRKVERIFDDPYRRLVIVQFEECSKILPNKAGKIQITIPLKNNETNKEA